jgi:hypothetical protein
MLVFSHLSRLLPEETNVYLRLETAFNHLLDCMRQEDFFHNQKVEANCQSLASKIRNLDEALKAAGAHNIFNAQWHKPIREDARSLLTMRGDATDEWMSRVLGRMAVHEEDYWADLRQDVAQVAEAVLESVRPQVQPLRRAPLLGGLARCA